MNRQEDYLATLHAKLMAQAKTIQILMDTVEQQYASGGSSMELLTQNLALERVVHRKTEHLRQQGEALQKALKELQVTQSQLIQANKLESVGQLAAGIAHEINTPTQFIGSNVEFLGESFEGIQRLIHLLTRQVAHAQGDTISFTKSIVMGLLAEIDWEYLEAEIPAAIKQTKEGVKRIASIVQAMKEFSHPSSKEKIKNDINKLIETTVIVTSNEWKYVADVHTDLVPDLPMVSSLADELGQVFLNILVNAVHAIEAKINASGEKEKGVISIATRQIGEMVEIRISDSGTGIPKKIISRIFDPFFTTKTVGKGTGQGLAIAHDVVSKKHAGTLTVESVLGEGTTFVIQMPIEAAAGVDGECGSMPS
ncbi:MAG: ATP-binding protein [Desulfobulbus sp.]|nr:ATP-binding protein [Desulfobulbus sp.]